RVGSPRCGRCSPGCSAAAPAPAPPRSKRDGVALEALGDRRGPADLDHVDPSAERFLQVQDQLTEVQGRPARLELDQEVDVAVRTRAPGCDRTEDADV